MISRQRVSIVVYGNDVEGLICYYFEMSLKSSDCEPSDSCSTIMEGKARRHEKNEGKNWQCCCLAMSAANKTSSGLYALTSENLAQGTIIRGKFFRGETLYGEDLGGILSILIIVFTSLIRGPLSF